VCDIVVKKFTFTISSPDEFLFSKTDAERITKRHTHKKMFLDESWKPIYFWGQKVKATTSVSVLIQNAILPLLQ